MTPRRVPGLPGRALERFADTIPLQFAQVRRSRGQSLATVAGEMGISDATLSRFERGQLHRSLTVWQLVTILNWMEPPPV